MLRQRQRARTRSGATAVEFALCFPILLSVIFGLLEFSRVTQLQQSARLAAFEGARAGIPLDATSTDVQTAVNKLMSAVNIPHYTTTITPAVLSYTSPTITVNITLSPTANAWVTWFVTSNSTISASVTLIREVQSVSVP